MEFTLYGKKISYSQGIENYNVMYSEFQKYMRDIRNGYVEAYYEKFSNIGQVVTDDNVFNATYIQKGVEKGIQWLIANGVKKYDTKRFMKEYDESCFKRIDLAFMDVSDAYDSIVDELNEKKEYRAERKANRSRWEGGGYGFEGAVKGAAQAGSLNMASGAAHSIVNLVGNAGSSIAASIQKSNMFKDRKIPESFMTAIVDSIDHIADDFARIMIEEENIEMEIPSCESKKLTDYSTILNNIDGGLITGEEIKEYCLEMIEVLPYYERVYKTLLKYYKDPNNELETLSNHFGLQYVSRFKKSEIEDRLGDIDYFNPAEFQKGQKDFLTFAADYGISQQEYIGRFDNLEKEMSTRRRTVDGMVYDTEEEAEEKRRAITGLIDRISGIEGNDREALRRLMEQVKQMNIKSESKYIAFIDHELEEADVRYRTVAGEVYDTLEEAEIARQEAKDIVKPVFDESFETIEAVEQKKNEIASLKTGRLKGKVNDYLSQIVLLIEKQKSILEQPDCLSYETRCKCAEKYYDMEALYNKSTRVHALTPEFRTYYEDVRERYVTVNGTVCVEGKLADDAYYKWIDHARKYKHYIDEKNAEKKSFFGALKNGVTGLVYKNYEPEYNSLTDNGRLPIPNDQMEEKELTARYRMTAEADVPSFGDSIDKSFGSLTGNLEVEKKSLSAKHLWQETEEFTVDEVESIIGVPVNCSSE